MLTIGKDAVDAGGFAWFQGVQLSVFDVSDFGNPQRVGVEIVGERGTESEALYDPHAFAYYGPAGMLAVPMRIAENAGEEPSSFGTPSFSGLCLFSVDPYSGVAPMGRVATEKAADFHYGPTWTRGLFIGDQVYAVTPDAVRAVPQADMNSIPVTLSLE